ncbi:MAG: phosphoenolpyruvate--protein phosphotransferase [Thermomicrobiales bacterium]|nr:phosphoenolpyruvate--protein phosphotransferase [Thermomicrobiales bacterium]
MSRQALSGTPAADGIAAGTIFVFRRHAPELEHADGPVDAAQEAEHFSAAVATTRSRIEAARTAAAERAGDDEAAIFDAHLMFLDDPAFVGEIEHAINERPVSADTAVREVADSIVAMFEELDDEYLRARAADVRDVANQLRAALSGADDSGASLPNNAIVVADEIFPSDTSTMDLNRLAGIATERGSPTAHVAILARALGVPTIVGVANLLAAAANGQLAILDGSAGTLVLDPTDSERDEAAARIAEQEAQRQAQAADRDLPVTTTDGVRISLEANIGVPAEAEVALAQGATGIGLFRTEFLFVDQPTLPDEETQFRAYRHAAEVMGEHPVIIRTLDAGGDKPLPSITDRGETEMNPFLGVRGLRLCLQHPDLFRSQVRALLRAATVGNLWIMFPMVANIADVRDAQQFVAATAAELTAEGIEHNPSPPLGIMIEIPSAAAAIDLLIGEVDFVSIGTNDLVQYTLAVDRTNPTLARRYPADDIAVLRLIHKVLSTTNAAGKYAGICGEMAGDPAFIPLLLGLGARDLSMGAARLDAASALIRATSLADARRMAEERLNPTS